MNNTSNKKHIIITGSRGIGKTTLLKKIITDMNTEVPGLTTWCKPHKAVYMSLNKTTTPVMIGQFNPNSSSKENRMQPVPDGFNVYGVRLLDKLIHDSSEWVFIDEIGYLESSCVAYTKKLYEVFDKKRVIAVVRKQDLAFLRDICNHPDALLIDLDK